MVNYLSITPPAGKGLALSLPSNEQGVIAADKFLRHWVKELSLDDQLAPGQRSAPAGNLYDLPFKKLLKSQQAQKHASMPIGGTDATIWRLEDGTACLSFRDPSCGRNTLFPAPFFLDTSDAKDLGGELRAWRDIHDQLPRLHLAKDTNPREDLAVPTWLAYKLITYEDEIFLRQFAMNVLISLPIFFPELSSAKIYGIDIGSRGVRRDGSILSPKVSLSTIYAPSSNSDPSKEAIGRIESLICEYLSDPDFPIPPERQVALVPISWALTGDEERLHEIGRLAWSCLKGDMVPSAHETIQALHEMKKLGKPLPA